MKKIRILLCLAGLILINGVLFANTDPVVYLKKSGTIPQGRSVIFNFVATTDMAQFGVIKRQGYASGRVEIYVNNVFKESMDFSASGRNVAKSKTINQLNNKRVQVRIIHTGGEGGFQYELSCVGDNLTRTINAGRGCPRGYTNGSVKAGSPKIMEINPLCNRIDIIIQRTGGQSAGEVIIYLDNIYTSKLEFPKGQSYSKRKTLVPLNGRTIKIKIINKGASGTLFNYKMETRQSN